MFNHLPSSYFELGYRDRYSALITPLTTPENVLDSFLVMYFDADRKGCRFDLAKQYSVVDADPDKALEAVRAAVMVELICKDREAADRLISAQG